MSTSNKLKAFVRFDGSGRVVPSSVILARFKPKVGNYQEIDSTECCEYIPTTTTTTTSGEPTTTTTTTTPTPGDCFCYTISNETAGTLLYSYTDCGSEFVRAPINADTISIVCSSTAVTGDDGLIITGGITSCSNSEGCSVEPTTTTTTTAL
jgi:hypothetical protein